MHINMHTRIHIAATPAPCGEELHHLPSMKLQGGPPRHSTHMEPQWADAGRGIWQVGDAPASCLTAASRLPCAPLHSRCVHDACRHRFDIAGWCPYPGALATWNLARGALDASRPDRLLATDSCLTAAAFHPTEPVRAPCMLAEGQSRPCSKAASHLAAVLAHSLAW